MRTRALTFVAYPGSLQLLSEGTSLKEATAQLPQGAYTTLRTYRGNRVLWLDGHVARLNESTALLGVPDARTLSADAAREALRRALAASGFPESRLRLTWASGTLYVTVEAFEPLPEALYRDGVRCVTLGIHRSNPHAKDTRFIPTATAALADLPPGVHEGLLVNESGEILEGLSSNFFAVVDSVLRTEEDRVLHGVTRGIVLRLAREVVTIDRRAPRRDELDRMSEAFLTSVSRGVLPVVEIDRQQVGDGAPGLVSLALIAGLHALEENEAEAV